MHDLIRETALNILSQRFPNDRDYFEVLEKKGSALWKRAEEEAVVMLNCRCG